METESIPVSWYASTFRRRFIDVAEKIVYSGRKIILKTTKIFFELFSLPDLWHRTTAVDPVPIL